jgi:Fe2+ transport system protein FeoA
LRLNLKPVKNHLSAFAKKGEQLFCEAWKAASKPLTAITPNKPCGKPLCPAGIFALAKLPCGVCVMVKTLDELAHDTAESLRRMGIREGSRVSLISSNDPMLIVVENTRIALSHNVACHIKVEALH